MTDIVERLRIIEPDAPGSKSHCFRNPDGPEAADEIERLREALRPFACKCNDGFCTEYMVPINEAEGLCEHHKARFALEEKE